MSAQSKIDQFAQIAFGNHPVSKEELSEVPPLEVEKRYFSSGNHKAERINQISYDENLEKFYEELKAMREKYRRFMSNFSPKSQMLRRQWEQNEFQFRYEACEDKTDFNRVIKGEGRWEHVNIPDYRGPVGKWTGFYRREFNLDIEKKPGKRIFLKFLGADYIVNVYLNGRYIGSHEGIFAPFEFDVTDYLHFKGVNNLVVEIKNDAPTLGLSSWDRSQNINGDKIYAATGIGWDDPYLGWHHCPPGAGIYNRVILEERSELFVHSIFVRPDIDNSTIEAWVEIYNCLNKNQDFELKLSVYPRNFEGSGISDIACQVEPLGPGINYYRFTIPFENHRLWTPEEPWLYTIRASIYNGNSLLDEMNSMFGMRKFHTDESGELKGTLYLNNKPVILRGANDMGHMQLCVMRGDYNQLIDDILIAKLANMNYYRFTQRPVQEEIYEFCDMLGMMNQTDLPLFGYLRRNQFIEAVRQSREMERLIRSHPSSIMVTFINEPFSVKNKKLGHRHLYRDELEDFFDVARKVVKLENPDRVIKNVEGDYDPPTRTGLSDFHCYNMWYTNHALPIGKLHKGYLPPIKKGWKTGCGEYGAEGLDPIEVMMEDYPKDWVPEKLDDKWTPERIVRAQTYSMHGDWYEEQYNITDWIRESQEHQAVATRLLTDAFRRRSDRIISTAVHLLIDAWPSGWMKTLVDYRRKPKPAYFAFRDSLIPVRVNLRTDCFKVYEGEQCEIEAWLLNDTPDELKNWKIVATIRNEREDFNSFEINADAKAVYPNYAGTISFKAPLVEDREKLFVDAVLTDDKGNAVNAERLTLEVFKRNFCIKCTEAAVIADKAAVGDKAAVAEVAAVGDKAKSLIETLGMKPVHYKFISKRPDVVVISDYGTYLNDNTINTEILQWVKEGTKAIFLLEDFQGEILSINDINIKIKKMNGLTFIARNVNEGIMKDFGTKDFSFWYNQKKGYIDIIADKFIETENDIHTLLFTYQKPKFTEFAKGEKKKLPIAGYAKTGKGHLIFLALITDGFAGVNPILDRFLKKLMK